LLAFLQKIGKSLNLPLATLPAAALLQRFGKIDYIKDFHLGDHFGGFINQYVAPFLLAGGDAIFNNLPLIFAIGVAIGLAGDAVAALAAAIAYQVLINVLPKVPIAFGNVVDIHAPLDMGVVGGIIAGIISSYVFKRFHSVQLPEWLAFFSGKRSVPIITSLIMIVVAIGLGMIWGPIQESLDTFGRWTVGLGGIGAAIFGIANRLLIPFGLHHVINNVAWFQIGSFRDSAGREIQGDLARYFAGDETAGLFMTGFYPIMLFALPAGALAIIHTAKPDKRKVIKSVFLGVALTSFLTGVTEPMEFAFMFAAPVLYFIHALLTGLSGFIVASLGIKLGFGFSAGLLDYLISFQQATKPLLIIPVGLCFAVVYYILFRFLIIKFNLKTPGREDDLLPSINAAEPVKNTMRNSAHQVLDSIGGSENIGSMDACITRLRLVLKNDKLVNDKKLKELGATGVMRLGQGVVQIIFGMHSERLKDEIEKIL
jgi:PTS system N-acetylglucosamine-specific IIC component